LKHEYEAIKLLINYISLSFYFGGIRGRIQMAWGVINIFPIRFPIPGT